MKAINEFDSNAGIIPMVLQDVNGNSGFAAIMYPLEHARRHASQMFFASAYVTGILTNGTTDFGLQVGAKDLHLSMDITFGGDVLFELHAGGVWSAGTPLGIHNARLASDGILTPLSSIVQAPTISNAGTIIRQQRFPGGTTGNAIGDAAFDEEVIYPASTSSYFFRVTNLASTTQWLNILFRFYEYTPL